MIRLNFPEYKFRISKSSDNKTQIFDIIRKKNVMVTPEEWVRQHMIRYLIEEKNYPPALISVESGIKINRLFRRYDAMVSDRGGKPIVLIECKAPEVKISQDTFDQIVAYNITVKAKYLFITNGLKHYACILKPDEKSYRFLPDIPDYEML